MRFNCRTKAWYSVRTPVKAFGGFSLGLFLLFFFVAELVPFYRLVFLLHFLLFLGPDRIRDLLQGFPFLLVFLGSFLYLPLRFSVQDQDLSY